jgi:hypothetical protein
MTLKNAQASRWTLRAWQRSENLCRRFPVRVIIGAVLGITKTTGRMGFVVLIVLAFAIVGLIVGNRSAGDRHGPRFVAGTPTFAASNQWTWVGYSWGAPVRFRDGKFWLWARTGTNLHTLQYDLESDRIVGELFNANSPLFANQDQTKLLCEGPDSFWASMKQRLAEVLKKVFNGKIPWQPYPDERFWILDFRNNQSKPLGGFSQFPGNGSTWWPAPGFRYGYNTPTTILHDQEFFICDLEKDALWRMQSGGGIQGWWDDHTLLIQDKGKNLSLLDVVTRSNSIAFSAEAIKNFLRQSGLADDLNHFRAMPTWNGTNYTLYFHARTNWVAGDSYLLKLNQTSSSFEIVQREFRFRWQGMFDATATHYLFDGESGEPGRAGNGGVYLLDLESNTTRTLVEPDHRGQYAISRLYQDRVIYFRNRQIWSINLDGSHNFRIFPPASDAN